jgi:hypothetical protein
MKKDSHKIGAPTRQELLEALEELVRVYVSNRGTHNQFVTCITPGRVIPSYWKWALELLRREAGGR